MFLPATKFFSPTTISGEANKEKAPAPTGAQARSWTRTQVWSPCPRIFLNKLPIF